MNTRDITTRFQKAAQRLAAGRLIKDDHFSLFEAVGALEIGDPKMDSGCLEPGEALEDYFDMDKEILPGELIWLMDQMLNREVAWLMGYPLSQTLFTSVHIDRLLWPDPKTAEDATFVRGRPDVSFSLCHQVLRAYCLLLVKACDLVLGMVTSQHYYEEEDFTTQLFNRELLHRFDPEEIGRVGSLVIDSLQECPIGTEIKQAILDRLGFRMELLEMLSHHSRGSSPPTSLFASLRDYLVQQRRTQDLGNVVEGAFSTKLQRRLASTVPPRPMVTVTMDEAWSFWSRMLEDCENVFSVQLAECSQDLFTAYLIHASRAPQPSTYPRALLQSFLTLDDGLVGGRIDSLRFMEEDIRTLTLPASQLLSASQGAYGRMYNGNQKVAQCMQSFVDKFEHTFTNLYRALCLNGCRIRRTFCHALLEWDSKQGEVEEIETIIHAQLGEQPIPYPAGDQPTQAFPLSSWIYHHKLNLLRLTVQMGFDQMIYAPHELAGMYSYLASICSMHLSHLERIGHFVTARDVAVKSSQMRAAARQNGIEECKHALDRLFKHYAWLKATQLLATTIHYIFALLQRHGVFVVSESIYSTDALRYDIRMKPFLSLSAPEPLSSQDYHAEAQMSHIDTEVLLEQAAEFSSAAKRAWEEIAKTSWNTMPTAQTPASDSGDVSSTVLNESWNADVKDCIKASIAASLCVVTLRKMVGNKAWISKAQQDAKIVATGEKGRWHRWWIIPSLPNE